MAGSVAGGDGVAVEGSVSVKGSAACGSKAGGSVTAISAAARRPVGRWVTEQQMVSWRVDGVASGCVATNDSAAGGVLGL